MSENGDFHGLEMELRMLPGARALRVIHPRLQTIEEHSHDWPCLTLFSLGRYTEYYDGSKVDIGGPSAVFHPAGGTHANVVHEEGLETVSIQFDPHWLCARNASIVMRPGAWIGGPVAIAARKLSMLWADATCSEPRLRSATARFLLMATKSQAATRPAWLDHMKNSLEDETPPPTRALAKSLDLHPAWLVRAYRAALGEGVQETLRRKRVERAVKFLRESDWPLAEIAVAAGFYDQSHMNRGFRILMGRTPSQVREERALLARFDVAGTVGRA